MEDKKCLLNGKVFYYVSYDDPSPYFIGRLIDKSNKDWLSQPVFARIHKKDKSIRRTSDDTVIGNFEDLIFQD